MFVDQNAVVTDPATGLVYSVGGYAGNSPYGFTYVYSPATGHWTQLPSMKYQREAPVATFINGKLYVAGGIGSQGTALRSLEVYDPAASTWSAGAKMPDATYGSSAAVLDGKMYVIGGSPSSGVGTDVQVYNPSTNTWRQAAPYPEPIGYESCGAPASQIFCAGGATGNTTETSGAYSYNPATGTWSPIAPLPTQLWGSGYTAANGQLLVSGGVTADNTAITNQGYAYSPWSGTWSKLPNAPHAVYEAGSGCGLYEAGGLTDASVVGIAGPLAGAEQLPGYSACGPTDVPWLSASPSEVTLKPGQSTTVTVTLNAADASMPQPGTYTAGLIIENSTPYQVPDIGVTMTVTPPKAWGELTGAVTSGGKPLAGATVQIGAKKGSGQIYTTTTNANGQYTWWLPGKDNPERLIASDSGYAPQTQKARITAGQTTTANFVLQQQ
jgi:N-acetylneuraminic acid mutarotase